MKIKIRNILFILLPLILGSLIGLLTKNYMDYDTLVKPILSPPNWIFPVAWTILYILMGISSYIILKSSSEYKDDTLNTYFFQLIVNLFWSIIFFIFKMRLLSFIWLISLIIIVIIMIIKFYKINKTAGLLQIPYLLWLLFAAYLNAGIYLLNK